ncbi:MAG: hypothetical protein AB3N07_09480 [Ruegeria sp.]
MAEFDDIRLDLSEARASTHLAGRELFRIKQRRKRLEENRNRQARVAREGQTSPELAELDAQISDLEGRLEAGRARLDQAKLAEADIYGRFEIFTDPRERIELLNDRTPILLMPLRIETRFKRAEEHDGDSDEMWVRVYPDDIAVDVFEDTLSVTEAQQARSYWADLWSAGGVEAAERAAWSTLLGGQGSGRSHFVTETYRPLNEAEKPVPPEDTPWIILSVVSQPALIEPERTAGGDFWSAIWLAGDDVAAQTAAYDALRLTLGDDRAEEIQRDYRPRNLTTLPPDGTERGGTTVIVSFLDFPTDDEIDLRLEGWTQAPQVHCMPERLVLLGYNNGQLDLERIGNRIPTPLATGPDPSAEEDVQLKADEVGNIRPDPEFEWVTDFGKAIEVGMGWRVPLDPVAFRTGFDRLLVIGVRMRSDQADGQECLETLLDHHHRSKGGLSILPQGRPTNNVETEGAAYSWREDPNVSFDHYFGDAPDDPTSWTQKTDGRWLAEMLGLSPAALRAVPFYGHTDICDAMAMNTALWPATLGHFMESAMHPVFDEDTVEDTREFFVRHVRARGQLPAIRVGQQPYGILPATVRSRIGWLRGARDPIGSAPTAAPLQSNFLLRLYGLLRRVETDLEPQLEKVSFVGKGGVDRHQALLDVLGLHANSVEFQQRYGETFAQFYNRMSLMGPTGALLALAVFNGFRASGIGLLASLGFTFDEQEDIPDLLEKIFFDRVNQLKGPLIDDQDLSETDPIRAYTEGGENYLDWLRMAAASSHDTLRKQEGFADGPPNALLYLMLRHALDLSYVEISARLFRNAGIISAQDHMAFRREPAFVGIQDELLAQPQSAGGSRWQYLYRNDISITGNAQRTVGTFIPTVLNTMVATQYLERQLDAIDHLASRPTAALERAFVEHLDLCTYRLDAWYGGLLSKQLEDLRYGQSVENEATPGLYLGAYGYLEEVKPEFKSLTPVDLPDELQEIFGPGRDLTTDSTNQGYIHAPSLNHAVTAAVLRNGYISNATPENPDSLKVNLTSERVRLALSVIDGMKSNQSLGALLGYHFERGLHDRHDVEVDEYILDLRKVFPLSGERLKPTRTPRLDGIGRRIRMNRVEAKNVIDGLALVEQMASPTTNEYPFGKSEDLPEVPDIPQTAVNAINEEARRIADIADAVADLAMAESVHQVVQGNYDRAGAVLDTYSKGKFPDTPDVIKTPRSGVVLTHRVALHLRTGLDPNDAALTSPRAQAEPGLNDWLSGQLPDPARIAAEVTLTDPLDQSESVVTVTAADLGLLPLDLLYLLDPTAERAARTLDDLIETFVITTQAPRADVAISISYRRRIGTIPDHVPFFELAALTRAQRKLLLRTRPLRVSDMSMVADTVRDADLAPMLNRDRIALPRAVLNGEILSLVAVRDPLQARIDAEERDQIISEIDQTIADFAARMVPLTVFDNQGTGTAAVFADRRSIATEVKEKLTTTIERLDTALASFDQLIADFDGDPGADPADRLTLLHNARRLIMTDRSAIPPADPEDFRNDLAGPARTAFVAHRDALETLHNTAPNLSALFDGAVVLATANTAFDLEPLDLTEAGNRIVALAEDMAVRATALIDDLTRRRDAVDAQLAAHDAAATGDQRVEALDKAAKILFGDEFKMVPEFALPQTQGDEWANAWGLGPQADTSILDHQRTTLGNPFPVDDWFLGVARVHERLHDLEAAGQLAEALAGAEIELQPVQFPHRPDVPWLAVAYPRENPDGSDFIIDEDKLLYTGHFRDPFNASAPQAGLLIEEWTETIPSPSEDTGLAFHYDRPNSEPPQTMLLALTPQYTGEWRWQDLVDTVHETMDLAKKRAIEPDHIDTTAYARFLPALLSTVTLYPITAQLNFSFNNNLAATLNTGGSDE